MIIIQRTLSYPRVSPDVQRPQVTNLGQALLIIIGSNADHYKEHTRVGNQVSITLKQAPNGCREVVTYTSSAHGAMFLDRALDCALACRKESRESLVDRLIMPDGTPLIYLPEAESRAIAERFPSEVWRAAAVLRTFMLWAPHDLVLRYATYERLGDFISLALLASQEMKPIDEIEQLTAA